MLAVGIGYLGIRLLLALKPADLQRPEQVHLSLIVLLFTMAVGTLAGIIFALIPAIYISKTDVNAVLKETTSGQRHPGHVRGALVVGEVGLAVVLLIAAAFMIGSLVSVLHVDPGFRADHVLTMNFSLPRARYAKNDQFAHFCQQALERIAALPGVKSASFSDGLPMTRIRMMKFTVDGQAMPARGSEPTADMRGISSPAYFETLGIPIVAGRNFTVDELNPGPAGDRRQPNVGAAFVARAGRCWAAPALGREAGRTFDAVECDRRRRRHASGVAGELRATRGAASHGRLHQSDAGGAHRGTSAGSLTSAIKRVIPGRWTRSAGV